MLSRIFNILRVGVAILLLIFILIPFLLGLATLLWIFDVPRKVGNLLNFEDAIRKMLYWLVDAKEMRLIRDDALLLLESRIEFEDDVDRWELLRSIEESKREIERQLKNGEFAFTFVGSIAALVVGNLLGIVSGGILLTIVGLTVTFLVTTRIILTDSLCYRPIQVRSEPSDRLRLYASWNKGPIFGYGAVGVAVVSALASRGGYGYDIGFALLDWYIGWKYAEDEGKWRVD